MSTPFITEKRNLLGTVPTATGRKVSGYAAKFHSRSANLGTTENPWFEILAPGCFPSLATQDVRCLIGHDDKLILARSNKGSGTMQLSIDLVGLHFEFEAPQTQAADDMLESIRRKDLDACSFGFVVAKGGDSWDQDSTGARIRTINRIEKLLEISVVAFPAYASTSVSARNSSSPSRATDELKDWKARLNLR